MKSATDGLTPRTDEACDWLRLALRHLAHGADLRTGVAAMGAEDLQLARWEEVGWIKRLEFSPTFEQRAFGALGAPNAAKAQIMIHAHNSTSRMAYWWGPGEHAAEVLAGLPPVRGLAVGELVRYKPTFLRSIGCANDVRMLHWRGIVIAVGEAGLSFKLATVEHAPEDDCPCRLPGTVYDKTCYKCDGTGIARRLRVNVANLERTKR